ncbi:MAG: hypothetical protein M3251_05035 [Thermoproteota archaeon]|nr:hypothetical protein [Thermoproteota archaeon]MDQ3888620.1 hypothetical protein [Thermoproteota archaeon]
MSSGNNNNASLRIVKDRAFHTSSKYNSRTGIFDYCDLCELEVEQVPIEMDKIEWYRSNPRENL